MDVWILAGLLPPVPAMYYLATPIGDLY